MAEDPIVRKCLDDIRRGRVDAAGPMCDRMEEINHPLAKEVRTLWLRWAANVALWRAQNRKPRRNLTYWEEAARWHKALRRDIAFLFKRQWQNITVQKLEALNPYSPSKVEEVVEDE